MVLNIHNIVDKNKETANETKVKLFSNYLIAFSN